LAQHVIGFTLWSLGLRETVESLEAAAEMGFGHVQLAFRQETDLEPAGLERIRRALEGTGVEAVAGMIDFAREDYSTIASIRETGGLVPTARYEERLDHCRRAGRAYAALGLTHVTTHVGFLPDAGSEAYGEVVDRIGKAVDALVGAGLGVGLETGQESASQLLEFLADLGRPEVSVNYDPANLVLYGTDDPLEAARMLASRVKLAHMKDARRSDRPGEVWGVEVPLGEGEVPFPAVLAALEEGGFGGPLVIECEGGEDRRGDILAGRDRLRKWLG